MFVSIVIPTWNAEKLIEKCLTSVYKLNYKEFEVIVVDNASQDNSVHVIREKYPQTKIVRLDSNTGFSYAVNAGIKNSNGEYIALLNNDTEVDSEWLNELAKTFEEDKIIGIVTSKLINYFDRHLIDAAGDQMNIVGQAKSRGHGDPIDVWNKPEYVFAATGGASLYKKEVFEKIGLFEETFYMYFEDADLCYRAQKAGIKVYYQPKAVVYHMHRASSNKRSDMLDYLLYRNFVIFYLINTPKRLFFTRRSLLKFLMVFVHTAYFLAKNGKIILVMKVWYWLVTHLFLIKKLREDRNGSLNVPLEYIDSLRLDKKLKVFGKEY